MIRKKTKLSRNLNEYDNIVEKKVHEQITPSSFYNESMRSQVFVKKKSMQ